MREKTEDGRMRRNENEKKLKKIFQLIDFLFEFNWLNKITTSIDGQSNTTTDMRES
jgi:archaellum component FlaC